MTDPATVYTVDESVQIAIGKRWLDARVEEIIAPGFVRIRLCTGLQSTMTMPASSDRLRKWGEGKLAKKRAPMKGWKPPRSKRVRYQRVMPGTE